MTEEEVKRKHPELAARIGLTSGFSPRMTM